MSTPKGSLSEWLALHDLDEDAMGAILGRVDLEAGQIFAEEEIGEGQPLSISASDAWCLTATALHKGLPELSSLITKANDNAVCDFDADDQALPFTRNRGAEQGALVSMFYQKRPQDLLCVAHEFGHALQIECSEHRFTPPIHREIAAFLSELCLLEYVEKTDPTLHAVLLSAWLDENDVYLGEDLEFLESQLSWEDAPYEYRLNYPLARMIAFLLWKSSTASDLAAWFTRTMSLKDAIGSLEHPNKDTQMQSDLPEVPPIDEKVPALNAYRSLGIMALLDIEYLEGVSEQSIGDFYAGLRTHMQSQTAFIAMDEARKPIGYATWLVEGANEAVRITRQSAPFGHHLELQVQLEQHLPKDADVVSNHARSSRVGQKAW